MTDREQQVRERAYYMWEAEGRPHGVRRFIGNGGDSNRSIELSQSVGSGRPRGHAQEKRIETTRIIIGSTLPPVPSPVDEFGGATQWRDLHQRSLPLWPCFSLASRFLPDQPAIDAQTVYQCDSHALGNEWIIGRQIAS